MEVDCLLSIQSKQTEIQQKCNLIYKTKSSISENARTMTAIFCKNIMQGK